MRYEHAESDSPEDDSETRVFFDPVQDPTEPGPPTMLPDPLATVAYDRVSVRTFDAGKLERWQVPTLAAPVLPHMAPTAVAPPVIVAPELGAAATRRPWLQHAASYPTYPRAQVEPTYPPRAPRAPLERTHPVRRFARPARGVLFAVACVLVGIAIGGAIAITSSSHGKASAAPAQVATLPVPPRTPVMTVTPIIEPAAPAPARAVAAAPMIAEPAKQAAPVHVEARSRAYRAAPAEHAPAAPAPADDPDDPPAQGTLDVSSKPPCSIAIDGKPTGLMTPKKGLELSAGSHQVTLTNADQGIQLTAEVEIFANDSTRLVKDFTK